MSDALRVLRDARNRQRACGRRVPCRSEIVVGARLSLRNLRVYIIFFLPCPTASSAKGVRIAVCMVMSRD